LDVVGSAKRHEIVALAITTWKNIARYTRYIAEVSMDRIRIGSPAGYLRLFWIMIGLGYLF